MGRVIKATEKDIDKIVELIDHRIKILTLGIDKYFDDPEFSKSKYKNELNQLKEIREKMKP